LEIQVLAWVRHKNVAGFIEENWIPTLPLLISNTACIILFVYKIIIAVIKFN
jgi:hypothetical protein